MAEEDHAAVVIDIGAHTIKAGFAGDNAPRFIIPTIIGRPRKDISKTDLKSSCYVGEEAQKNSALLDLKYPLTGIFPFTDLDALEILWSHLFYQELRVAPEERPVMLTDSPVNTSARRERMSQLMFETFNTPALHITSSAQLALINAGRTTGVVLDSGESGTYAVPFYEGNQIHHATLHSELAGHHLIDFLKNQLTQRDDINNALNLDTVRDIKEKLCYTALDFDQEWQTAASSSQLERQYTLPDGQVITLNKERFFCPEALFQASFMGLDNMRPLDELIYSAVYKCDGPIRTDMYSNIVLAGGSTMFPGMVDRLHRGLSGLAPLNMIVKIIAPPDRQYSAWVGGSILASLSTFQQSWISLEQYAECGPAVVHYNQ